jgi:protein involved in polysaccharide export with SLBB domain
MRLHKINFVLVFALTLIPAAASQQPARNEQQGYVYVYGEVAKPGRFEFSNGLTLRQAMLLVNGTTYRGDLAGVRIISKDRTERTIDLDAVMKGRVEDITLSTGDVIVVPTLDMPQFIVAGEVKKPGTFELKPGMTVGQAAVLFGGIASNASNSRTSIWRLDQTTGRRSTVPIDLEGIMQGKKDDIEIQADDIIIVPEFGVSKIP